MGNPIAGDVVATRDPCCTSRRHMRQYFFKTTNASEPADDA